MGRSAKNRTKITETTESVYADLGRSAEAREARAAVLGLVSSC
jgi:hypothetical protein